MYIVIDFHEKKPEHYCNRLRCMENHFLSYAIKYLQIFTIKIKIILFLQAGTDTEPRDVARQKVRQSGATTCGPGFTGTRTWEAHWRGLHPRGHHGDAGGHGHDANGVRSRRSCSPSSGNRGSFQVCNRVATKNLRRFFPENASSKIDSLSSPPL